MMCSKKRMTKRMKTILMILQINSSTRKNYHCKVTAEDNEFGVKNISIESLEKELAYYKKKLTNIRRK